MSPEREGNRPPSVDPPPSIDPPPSVDPPSTFRYSVTYPASLYSPGPGQGAAPPEPSEPSALDKGRLDKGRLDKGRLDKGRDEDAARTRDRPVVRPAILAAGGLLVGVLVVLGIQGWPSGSDPDTVLRPTQPSPAAQSPTVDPAVTEAVEAWLRGGGQLVIDNLAADYHKVAAVTAANDVQGLPTVCGALRTSAETAQAYPPIPDAEAQVHWAASLAQSARAGTDCLAGVTANYLELVTQAGHEAGASSRESALLTARLQVVRGN